MHRSLHTASLMLVGYTVLVILWGAYVRVTGSGAGCADHWPLCNGQLVPVPERIETVIELTHRVTSGLAGVFAVGLWVWVRRVLPRGHGARFATSLGLFCMLLEGAIGAALVKLELVEDNASVARAVVIGVHLANTFLLLGAQVMTVHFAAGGGRLQMTGAPARLGLLSALTLTACVGSSGAVTALGDTLFPATSLAQGVAEELSNGAHFLLRLRAVHPVLALGTAVFVGYLALALRRASADRHVRRCAGWLLGLLVLQVLLGFVNLWLLAPAFMQIVHLLVADAVWIALSALSIAWFAYPRAASAAS